MIVELRKIALVAPYTHAQVAAITERGQLATAAQRNDVDLLVDRLEELKSDGPPYKDEDMVSNCLYCNVGASGGHVLGAP